MNRGIFTINIENIKTGEKKIIKKENAINPYYRWHWDLEDVPELLVIPNSHDYKPVIDSTGDINLPDDFWYWHTYEISTYNTYNDLWDNYPDLITKGITQDSKSLLSDGKHTYFSTDYIEGPFVLFGILIYWVKHQRTTGWGYETWERLFSALEVEPELSITEDERVYFHYELVQEWGNG
jgi:hypothetical protein